MREEDSAERRGAEFARERLYAQRALEVQVIADISQELATVPALDELLDRVVTLLKERLGYYHVQMFRYEPAIDAVVLVTGYGQVGERMLAQGHSLTLGRGVVGVAAATGRSVLAADVRQDAYWVPNPHLPDTKGELAVPIKLQDRVLGIIDVQHDMAGMLGQDDQLLLEALCGPIALALEAAGLRQEMEERLAELMRAQHVASEQGWQAWREVAELPGGYLYDRLSVRPADDLWLPQIGLAVQQRRPTPPTADGQPVVAPLLLPGGQLVGALGVYDDPQAPLSEEDAQLIELVAEQVARALESARLSEQTRIALAETIALNELAQAISSELRLQSLYEKVAQALVDLFGYETAWIAVGQDGARQMRFVARAGSIQAQGADLEAALSLGVHRLATAAGRERAPLVVGGAGRRGPLAAESRRLGLEGGKAVAVPVLVAGDLAAVIVATGSSEGTDLGERDVRLLEAVATQTSIGAQRAQLFEEVRSALAEVQATHRRYLRRAWDAYLQGGGRERQGYVLGSNGVETVTDLWLPEMERALVSGAPVVAIEETEQRGSALAVPLKIRGGQTIGVIELQRQRDRPWSQSEQELVESLVSEVAGIIEGERLFEQTQISLAEAARLYETGRRISEAESKEQILQVVLDAVASTSAHLAAVFLFDPPVVAGVPDHQEMSAFWGAGAVTPPVPLGTKHVADGFPLRMLLSSSQLLTVPDLQLDDRVDDRSKDFFIRQMDAQALVAVPLSVGSEWMGYVAVMTHALHTFAPEELRLYRAVNDQAAINLRSLRLLSQAERRARREELIREITSKIRVSPDLDSVLNTAVQELGQALGVSRAFVRLTLPHQEEQEPEADS